MALAPRLRWLLVAGAGLLAAAALVLVMRADHAVAAPTCTLNWTAPGDGFWDDAANWTDANDPSVHRAPASADVVCSTVNPAIITYRANPDPASVQDVLFGSASTLNITSGALTISDTSSGPNLSATALTMSGGSLSVAGTGSVDGMSMTSAATLTGAGTVTVTGAADLRSFVLSGSGSLVIASGQTATLSTTGSKLIDGRQISVQGTLAWTALNGGGSDIGFQNGAGITVANTGTFSIESDQTLANDGTPTSITVNAGGVLVKASGSGTSILNPPITSAGQLWAQSGTLRAGSSFSSSNLLTVNSGATFQANQNSSITGGTATVSGSLAMLNSSTLTLSGGVLTGAGTVTAALSNTGGTVNPGAGGSPAILTITGSYTQGPSGTLAINITGHGDNNGGAAGTTYDRLAVSGAAALNGVVAPQSNDPNVGESYTFITYGSHTGSFSSVGGSALTSPKHWLVAYGSTSATLTVAPGPVSAATSTVASSPGSVPADGSTPSTITVTLVDSAGHPISGKTVLLSENISASAQIFPPSRQGTSNASGVVTFTTTDSTQETVTYTATDTTDSITITQTAQVIFTNAVTVTSVTPNQGTTLGGATVTIAGTNFTGVTAVKFGTTSAAFTFVNDSTITATAPPGSAATVDVRVTANGVTSIATSSDHFTYIQPSTATSTTASTHQYMLSNSDGVTWEPMTCGTGTGAQPTTCQSNGGSGQLSLQVFAPNNSEALFAANSDLWTTTAGYNQDIGVFVSDAAGSQNVLAGWKESGGFAGTFSPNAAFVQGSTHLLAGHTYTFDLRWKANKSRVGQGAVPTIMAGAGPINFNGSTVYSPTRLSVSLFDSNALTTATSTHQYLLAHSDGTTWQPMTCGTDPLAGTTCQTDGAGTLAATVSPTIDSEASIGANSDLWTMTAQYNQDLGIFVTDTPSGGVPGPPTLLAWKESGGFAGTFSPNAAFVQATLHLQAGHSYGFDLRWKTNRAPTGGDQPVIAAGAGPLATTPSQKDFSPTWLTVAVTPAGNTSLVTTSTRQYGLTNNDGSTWVPLACGTAPSTTCASQGSGDLLQLTFTPAQTCIAAVTGNADLWTGTSGYNQDLGVFIGIGANVPALQSGAWKESGGFAGIRSPNAATVRGVFQFSAGTSYTVELHWKHNQKPQPGSSTIQAGAGPVNGVFSPTSLVVSFLSCS